MLPRNIKSEYSNRNSVSFDGSGTTSKYTPAAKIKVIGVGGAGGNIVRRMLEVGLEGVKFWVMNTDLQALQQIHADGQVQLGNNITRGLGAGMSPEVGRQAAEESLPEIEASLTDTDMVFITAGMGGGTGTGAAPVVAEVAKRLGILTIGVVTKPFNFEGAKRRQLAEEGIERLKASADAVIIVPNERLLQIVDKRTSFQEAFRISDDILRQAVQGISDIINIPGEVNVDFADIRAVMSNAGTALMGMGRASGTGEGMAKQAAMMAIDSPLLELSIDGARGVVFNVQGGKNMSLIEISEAAEVIREHADPDAKIIFGASTNPDLQDEIRVTVIATGFSKEKENNTTSPYINYTNRDRFMGQTTTTGYPTPRFGRDNLSRDNKESKDVFGSLGRVNNNLGSQSTSNTQNNNQYEDLEIPAFLRNRINDDKNF